MIQVALRKQQIALRLYCCSHNTACSRLGIKQVQSLHELVRCNIGTKCGEVQLLQSIALLLPRLQRL